MNNKIDNNFNAFIYKSINSDLKGLSNKDAYEHYINIGINEGRRYKLVIPNDFDPKIYKEINNDLTNMSDEEAFQHYNNHGFYENRRYKILTDFDLKIYKKINDDLTNLSDEEAFQHYNNHGFFEDRKYKVETPNDFDPKIYKKINDDLNNLTDEEAFKHYNNQGFFENRQYKVETPHDSKKKNLYNFLPFKISYDISMYLNTSTIEYSKKSFIKESEIDKNIPRNKHNSKKKINIDLIGSCILIIDFSNLGGGTSFFIESIITRYKKCQTFLIARNFKSGIFFTINDDCELEQSYNQDDAVIFISNIKDKIEKIFINHTLNHSYYFLNNLFLLEKEITTITHDFSLLFNEYSMLYNDMDNYMFDETKQSKININKYNQIITQNVSNLYIYNNYIQDKNKIVITDLPDFKNSKDLINTSNSEIVIGIIGTINNLKGSEQLKQIIEYYEYTNIKVIVFGNTNIETIKNCYPYNNIDELNELLITHKPNILIELSIFHETYSYTLTIGMITQLPILYLKKNGISVIENRLSIYNKSYEFSTLHQMNILVKSKKQDFFYTIEPIIYFNDFWDDYFTRNSKIIIPDKIEMLNSLNILNFIPDINNYSNNIIISMTAIPNRFLSDEFINVLNSICNQIIKPKYIVINLCSVYKRNFEYNKDKFNIRINYIKENYDNIIINFSEDYGPITKIIGLIHLDEYMKNDIKNDFIIILDDDWKYKNTLTYYYKLVYSLYNCDAVFIDERNIINWDNNSEILTFNEIFYDNYQNFAYGWLSFSIKYKFIEKLYSYYNEIIKIKSDIIKHDDLIITLFYKVNKLYACGINIFMNINEKLEIDSIDALRCENNSWEFRDNLERYFLNYYDINYELLRNHLYIVNNNIYDYNIVIDNKISIRNNLFNVGNITYTPELNDFQNHHLDIKYYNKNIFILTITNFTNNYINNIDNLILNIDNDEIKINVSNESISNKKTFFYKYKNVLSKIDHKKYNFNIIQTYNNNNISINRLYSISTILSYLPDINYVFFNETNRTNYIYNYNIILLYIYNKLNIGAYKADFFRALYIYLNGGVYFDCKNILFRNINYLLDNEECYTQDIEDDHIYNGFIYCSLIHNNRIREYIKEIIYNIHNSLYLTSSLEITGPKLFGKFINTKTTNKTTNKKNANSDNWMDSYIVDSKTTEILIKNSYYNYYNESNYLNTDHYSILYANKLVYNQFINYDKINFIDHILWINLDRSNDRKNYMINILNNINIPNTRISAIDGKNEDVKSYINIEYEKELSNFEIGCNLSHIKAINYLNNLDGNYFMICEDDISFDNINLFKENLENIITNCPSFDILLLSKIFDMELNDLYTDWNNYFNINNIQIAGTGCYVISRSGINNIIKDAYYDSITKVFELNKDKKFDVSDIYIYKNLKTYVYKFDFIGIEGQTSTIHEDHIDWQQWCLINQKRIIINTLI